MVTQSPQKGAGCIVALIGLIFTPLLLGLPVLIYGLVMMSKKEHEWACTGCGLRLPAIASSDGDTF